MAKSKLTKQAIVKPDYELLVEQGMHEDSQSARHCSEIGRAHV